MAWVETALSLMRKRGKKLGQREAKFKVWLGTHRRLPVGFLLTYTA